MLIEVDCRSCGHQWYGALGAKTPYRCPKCHGMDTFYRTDEDYDPEPENPIIEGE